MVDAPGWGQDWGNILLNNASTVVAADTLANTIFSIHLYEVYSDANTVNNYITTFPTNHELPLIIGEFAADSINGDDVVEEAIMSISNNLALGYLGWSWSGHSGTDTAEALDIVLDYDLASKTDWGETLINSEFGLVNTAETASVFAQQDDSSGSEDSSDSSDSDTSDSDDDATSDTSDADTESDSDSSSTDVNINIGAFAHWLLLPLLIIRR